MSLTEFKVFGEGERVYSSVNETTLDNVRIYPNPATSEVTLSGVEEYDTITIFDQLGRRVIRRSINNFETIDISELQSGIFVVSLEGNDIGRVIKMIKL